MNSPPPIRREQSYGGKAPRNIVAPYQQQQQQRRANSSSNSSSTAAASSASAASSAASGGGGAGGVGLIKANQNPLVSSPTLLSEQAQHAEFVDYRNYAFPPLEPASKVTFDKYCGPTPESNWVVPNFLLVGAYPASTDDNETLDLITSILKLGVNKFVCLQQEYREHGVTEEMWRSGQALRPYFEDVRTVVRQKAQLPCLSSCSIDEAGLSFVHFPIRDCGITDDERVLELARNLVKNIAEGQIIYLHCWGGHGRTGTVVCIMLHLMYGLDPVESMSRCQLVHDLRQCPVVVGSPQTQTQRDQVTRVIHRLMTQTSFHRRTLSGDGSMLLSREGQDMTSSHQQHQQHGQGGGGGSARDAKSATVSSGSPRPVPSPVSASVAPVGQSQMSANALASTVRTGGLWPGGYDGSSSQGQSLAQQQQYQSHQPHQQQHNFSSNSYNSSTAPNDISASANVFAAGVEGEGEDDDGGDFEVAEMTQPEVEDVGEEEQHGLVVNIAAVAPSSSSSFAQPPASSPGMSFAAIEGGEGGCEDGGGGGRMRLGSESSSVDDLGLQEEDAGGTTEEETSGGSSGSSITQQHQQQHEYYEDTNDEDEQQQVEVSAAASTSSTADQQQRFTEPPPPTSLKPSFRMQWRGTVA